MSAICFRPAGLLFEKDHPDNRCACHNPGPDVFPRQRLQLMIACPLVTVIMPVFNGERHLRAAIESILWQTMGDFELIIVDDGSSDLSRAIAASCSDPRIRIIENGVNTGLASSLNKGIDAARGMFIARMDCDDISYPDRFAHQLERLQNDPTLDLVATRAITIDEDHQAVGLFPCEITHEKICARPWLGFHLPHPTWMGRADWFRKYRYTVPDPYRSEDGELLLRSYRESRFATLDEILFAYRLQEKVNWRKQAKTRRAVLASQWMFFAQRRQWNYLFLATAAFSLKIAADSVARLSGFRPLTGSRNVSSSAVMEWQNVCTRVRHICQDMRGMQR